MQAPAQSRCTAATPRPPARWRARPNCATCAPTPCTPPGQPPRWQAVWRRRRRARWCVLRQTSGPPALALWHRPNQPPSAHRCCASTRSPPKAAGNRLRPPSPVAACSWSACCWTRCKRASKPPSCVWPPAICRARAWSHWPCQAPQLARRAASPHRPVRATCTCNGPMWARPSAGWPACRWWAHRCNRPCKAPPPRAPHN